jgi:hypothetical protein
LDISPLFSHIVAKLIQTSVITYDEIFQALAVKDVLLPKPFLGLGFDGVFRRKTPTSLTNVFSVEERPLLSSYTTVTRPLAQSEVRTWLLDQDISFHRQGLENLIVRYDKHLNKSGGYVEK